MVGVEVLCVGETMAQLTSVDGRSIEDAESFQMSAAGAESNVAIGLAQLGHQAAWLGRVGADGLGRRVVQELSAEGVGMHLVTIDESAQTGLFIKSPHPAGTTVTYYRTGSAGSRLTPAEVKVALESRPRHLHVSGVTPALSQSAADATHVALTRARELGITTSFDVNHRPALWPVAATASRVLRDLAQLATVVLVGLDEAQQLWGISTAHDCRALLPDVDHVVVKDGATDAVEFSGTTSTTVPALAVEVVEAVGAGDAFASGWIHGFLTGADATTRLRYGHLMAERALRSRGDYQHGPVSTDEFAARAQQAWGTDDVAITG